MTETILVIQFLSYISQLKVFSVWFVCLSSDSFSFKSPDLHNQRFLKLKFYFILYFSKKAEVESHPEKD